MGPLLLTRVNPTLRAPSPFVSDGTLDRPLIAVFLAIQGIILFNAIGHEPRIGYDALNHLRYIEAFSTFLLPTPGQSSEFFSPPLPYLLPAALRHYGLSVWGAAKAAQLLNVGYSLLLGVMVIRICEEIRPGNRQLKIMSLFFLGTLPVYYKSFAFVRGEPLLAALVCFVVHRALRMSRPGGIARQDALLLGLGLGLMILTRQWGFMLIPALLLFHAGHIRHGTSGRLGTSVALASAMLLASLVGGWFYLALTAEHGSMLTFNRSRPEAADAPDRPASYDTGTGGGSLFSTPTRPTFQDHLLPILYSEIWGDYWCYFLLNARDTAAGRLIAGPDLERVLSEPGQLASLETNYSAMARFLGRVNLVSLFPTALMVAGVLLGVASCVSFFHKPPPVDVSGRALLSLGVTATLCGYAWFAVSYSLPGKGDTAKATYLLQVFPLVSILTADLLVRIERRSRRLARTIQAAAILCALHNLPAMLTRMTF